MATVRLFALLWIQANVFSPELVRMPLLFAHYLDHWQVDGSLSMEDFLVLHYTDPGHEHADHDGHEDLPFHHHHGMGQDPAAVKVIIISTLPAVGRPPGRGGQFTGLTKDEAELPGHVRALLQPPKGLVS